MARVCSLQTSFFSAHSEVEFLLSPSHSFKFIDVFLYYRCSCGAPLPRRGCSDSEIQARYTFGPFIKAFDTP